MIINTYLRKNNKIAFSSSYNTSYLQIVDDYLVEILFIIL